MAGCVEVDDRAEAGFGTKQHSRSIAASERILKKREIAIGDS
jgi:hypothetical protein